MKNIYVSPFCDDEDENAKKAPEMPDPLTEKFLKTRQILLSGEINKDLAELMTVLASLKEKKIDVYKSHYRNCKLTQILSVGY